LDPGIPKYRRNRFGAFGALDLLEHRVAELGSVEKKFTKRVYATAFEQVGVSSVEIPHFGLRGRVFPDFLVYVCFGQYSMRCGLQHLAGGLQLRRPDGAWLNVPPLDGAFVVNVGVSWCA